MRKMGVRLHNYAGDEVSRKIKLGEFNLDLEEYSINGELLSKILDWNVA